MGGPLAAMDEPATGGHGFRHHVLYAVELAARAERTHLRRGIEGIADLDGLGALDDAGEQRLAQLVFDDQARAGDATLAAGAEDAGDDAVGRVVQIGIGEGNDRRFAAGSSVTWAKLPAAFRRRRRLRPAGKRRAPPADETSAPCRRDRRGR
jgi:hypothetical protein